MSIVSGRTALKIVLGIAVPVSVGWLIMATTTPSSVASTSATGERTSTTREQNAQLIRQLHRGADKHAVLPIRDRNERPPVK